MLGRLRVLMVVIRKKIFFLEVVVTVVTLSARTRAVVRKAMDTLMFMKDMDTTIRTRIRIRIPIRMKDARMATQDARMTTVQHMTANLLTITLNTDNILNTDSMVIRTTTLTLIKVAVALWVAEPFSLATPTLTGMP